MKNNLFRPLKKFRNHHRPADREAELIPLERILRGAGAGERIVLGIEPVVANELEHCAVKLIAAGLGGDVDLCGAAAELGRIHARLDLKLLERVDRGEYHIRY